MATTDNIIFEIKLDPKTKSILEKYSGVTEKLAKVMEKPDKHDSEKELKAAEKRDETEKRRHSNILEENKQYEQERRLTTQVIEQNRLNRMELKLKNDFLLQEKRMHDKMRLEERRHFNEMIQRMTSGTLVGKMMGVGLMGGQAGVSGARGLLGAGKKLAGKSAIGRALMLETGNMSDAENMEATGSLPIGFGDSQGRERTEQQRGRIRENPLANAFVKAMKKSKIFSDKMQGGMEKYGKGMAIGGIGALGIGGSIITKAIESSPIAQSMMKIMSTAFTLILRPIGDFFGGVMKPIAIRLLKFGAENVGSGASLFKMGEKVGIAALAMFTDPAAFFGALVERAFGTLAVALDPLKSEAQKATAYASMLDGFDAKMESIAGVTSSDIGSLVTQASTMVVSGLDDTMKTVEDGFAAMEKKADELNPAKGTHSEPFGGYGSAEAQQKALEEAMAATEDKYVLDPLSGKWVDRKEKQEKFDEFTSGHQGVMTPEMQRYYEIAQGITAQSDHRAEIGQDGQVSKEDAIEESNRHMQAYNDAYNQVLQNDIDKKREVLAEKNVELLATQEQFNAGRLEIQSTQQEQDLMYAGLMEAHNMKKAEIEQKMNNFSLAAAKSTQNIQSTKVKTEFNILEATNKLFKYTVKIYKDATVQLNALRAAAAAASRSRRRRRRDVGGMITEPVEGVGLWTGDTWTFGENGMEYVTPTRGRNGGGDTSYDQRNNVTVNVNIDKVSSEVDLQKIKPIVERALRESHSRRGII